MTQWLQFKPQDTMFFKGTSPMAMGQDHTTDAVFPPLPSTIQGALRTAILRQQGVSIDDYSAGNVDKTLIDAIGEYGYAAPFTIIGPMFQFCGASNQSVFIPSPQHWFVPKNFQEALQEDKRCKMHKAHEIISDLVQNGAGNQLCWIQDDTNELKSIGGTFIEAQALEKTTDAVRLVNQLSELDSKDSLPRLLSLHQVAYPEERTGIARDKCRVVREGHIYTYTHYRLHPSFRLIFGVSHELPLEKSGILSLGGEQRFGAYDVIEKPLSFKQEGGLFVNLSPHEVNEASKASLKATGKIVYRGGFDLKKGFHKPAQAYYPAGSVFSEKLAAHFMAL